MYSTFDFCLTDLLLFLGVHAYTISPVLEMKRVVFPSPGSNRRVWSQVSLLQAIFLLLWCKMSTGLGGE